MARLPFSRPFGLAALISTAIAAAFAATAPLSRHFVFDVFGEEQGLRNLVVTSLCEDRDGYLWVGTVNGLYRYDGLRFLSFSTVDGLPDNLITSVRETADGTLWVGTGKGLTWRSGIRFRAPSDPSLHTLTPTQSVASDAQGRIFLATSKGLAIANRTADGADLQLQFLPPPSTETRRVVSVWSEPQGPLWFGCGAGICQSEHGQVRIWGEADGVPPDGWQYLLKDKDGNFWARSRVYLIELPAGEQHFHTISQSDVAQLHFSYPSLTLNGNTLLVPSDIGLSLFHDGVWERMSSRQGLPSSIVTAAFRDRTGSLWIGATGGLVRSNGFGQSESFTENEGFSSGGSLSLLEGKEGGIWAGTGAGLSRGVFQNGAWKFHTLDDPRLIWIVNLAQSSDGAIWLTTVDKSVTRLDPHTERAQQFGQFGSMPYSIMVDRHDNLWVMLTHALYRGNALHLSGGFEQIQPPGTGKNTVFTHAVEDPSGDIWVGTLTGLLRLSHGVWSQFTKTEGLSGRQVNTLVAAPNGDLFSTYWDESVLDVIHPSATGIRAEAVDRKNGLEGDKLYSMHIDRQNRLWMLTDHGLRMRDIDRWIPFDRADGLLWNDCNTFLAAADGNLWIGSDRGLNKLATPQPQANMPNPAVRFSEVWLGDHRVDSSARAVEVRPETFTVKFSTHDLARARRLQYRYRMTNFENNWTETTKPEATFDYLRPGRYALEVQARWPGSPWSGKPAALSLEVRPRWFESWWFYSLTVAGLCACLFAAWKARVRYYAVARTRLEAEVTARTAELHSINEQLREEIAARERSAREKERLEEELFQARKLESIGRLAGGVAHDFNNLLTVINGYSALLLNKLGPHEKWRYYAVEIGKAGERAAGLTKQLLAFSRKQMIRPQPIQLNVVVRDIQPMLERLIGEDVKVVTSLDPALGQVMADSDQVHQVLMNLIVNARDAMPDGGTVVVATRNVDVGLEEEATRGSGLHGPCVLLSVNDSGAGMDEETLRNVFEPFFTTKGPGRGTGLGLSTVYGIIRQSGGWIDVSSRLGQGTTFNIYLPLITAAPADAPIASGAADLAGRETILVVEDQDGVRDFARAALESYGYKVLEARDGQDACHKVERYKEGIDLLLTDTVMPGMNGKVLSQRLAALRPNIRVLFMSGYTADAIGQRGVLEADVAYIQKPFSAQSLAVKVRDVLTTVSDG